jgi:hypothetical protein
VLLLRDKPIEDPTSEHVFVFGNAARILIKILCSDAGGIWVCGKRHARDRFRWTPREEARDAGAKACLSSAELSMLLHGLSQMPGGARSAACLVSWTFPKSWSTARTETLPVGRGEGVVEFAVSNGTPEGVGASPRVEGVRGAFEGETGVPEFDSPAHDGCVDPGVGRWSKENGALHRAWNAPLAPAGETIKV